MFKLILKNRECQGASRAEKLDWVQIPSNSRYRRERDLIAVRKIDGDIPCLMDGSQKQMQQLKEYLLELDKRYRVDPDKERNKNIQKDLKDIMDMIDQKFAKNQPVPVRHIVPMGSAHDGTKIGDPDEFDFVFQYKQGEDLHTTQFREFLHDVVQDLQLPPGWTHGGFNSPRFSGIREAGVSHLLQFEYSSSSDQTPLRLSVDFVPMQWMEFDQFHKLKLFGHMRSEYKPDSLDHYTEELVQTSKPDCFWVRNRYQTPFPQFGLSERELLSRFPYESTPKILIRVCKVLTRLTMKHLPRHPKCSLEEIHNYQKLSDLDKAKWKLPSVEVEQYNSLESYLPNSENPHITCSDINETIPDKCMVKSHLMKVIVLSMILADKPLNGREWTDDDLPHLVISAFLLLLESVKHKRRRHMLRLTSKRDVKTELLIHLTRKHRLAEDREPATHQSTDDFDEVKERLLWLLDDFEIDDELSDGLQSLNIDGPTFYANTKPLSKEFALFHRKDLPITISRISAIFQIFRSVCEEQDVNMVTHNALEASTEIIDVPFETLHWLNSGDNVQVVDDNDSDTVPKCCDNSTCVLC